MMDRAPKPPDALLQAIAADLRPVKPAPLPFRLALRMAPLALLLSASILFALGVRPDSRILGPLLTWGASAAQFALALVLVWVAAHESTPAARLPRRIVYAVAATAALSVITITLSTFSMSPGGPRRVPPLIGGLICGLGGTLAGAALVLLCTWIFRNSLATRPTLAGGLYGLGAGIAINAGWRIACPVSTLGHALGAHGVAILATTLIGALIGRAAASRRSGLPAISP
jgi:hypothetical protein